MRILVVEDDRQVASFIRRGLLEQRYAVDLARDGEEALFLAETETYDLVILDWLLPKRAGIEVLRALRADRVSTPVLLLTGKDALSDKIEGLDAGADDYLTKPFGFQELLARVRALLRRRGSLLPSALRVDDLEMDILRHKVTRNGQLIQLTNREFALLEFLMRHANELVTRTMLLEHVWERDFDPLSNAVDVHVGRLRKKIENGWGQLIRTVHGRGYILEGTESKPHRRTVTEKAKAHESGVPA